MLLARTTEPQFPPGRRRWTAPLAGAGRPAVEPQQEPGTRLLLVFVLGTRLLSVFFLGTRLLYFYLFKGLYVNISILNWGKLPKNISVQLVSSNPVY
jgi:hypothetical protein